MPDITMCKGDGCIKKEGCYRFKAVPDAILQSYFLEAPYVDNECYYFIQNYTYKENKDV